MIRAALILSLLATPALADAPLRLALGGGHAAASDSGSVSVPVTSSNGPLSELSGLFASDFAAAAKLSTSTSIQDGNGQACWTAFAPLGEIINAHPEIFTGKLATDIEAKRLAVIAARNLCNNVACGIVFQEEANMVQGFAKNLPPVSVNANFTPINLFVQACQGIPTLQIAPPTPTSSPTPAGN